MLSVRDPDPGDTESKIGCPDFFRFPIQFISDQCPAGILENIYGVPGKRGLLHGNVFGIEPAFFQPLLVAGKGRRTDFPIIEFRMDRMVQIPRQ